MSNALSSATGQSDLDRLPNELLLSIWSFLPNRDIKSLRLTCSAIHDTARLRLDRVFISANPRNVDVFRAIADHDSLRMGVVEIIWDDARLAEPLEDEEAGLYFGIDPDYSVGECPSWYGKACKDNIEHLWGRKGSDANHPYHETRAKQVAAQLPVTESWAYYQELLQQQRHVILSDADADAFAYGLQRFPSLRRITVTPATHGFTFCPLYETPMIRAFPYGFNYPIPRGWSAAEDLEPLPRPNPWVEEAGISSGEVEAEKKKWRGFSIVTRLLAQQARCQSQHRIPEFVIDVHQLDTGLNCHIFDQPCDEYDNLVAILQQLGFRRIDLALIVLGIENENWRSFRNGYLGRALGRATELEHVSLTTDVCANPDFRGRDRHGGGSIECFIPLRSIFPVDKWPNLRHFGLSRFLVQQADVLALLAALPETLRSVELNFLMFLDDGGTYRDLTDDMRQTFGWHKRAVAARPSVSIALDVRRTPTGGRAIWVAKEVHGFLYGDGPNPFRHVWGPNRVLTGVGVVRDEFEPAHERPNEVYIEMVRLGYYEEHQRKGQTA